MSSSKVAPGVRSILQACTLCVLALGVPAPALFAQGSGPATTTSSSGGGSSNPNSGVAAGQTQLYNATGQNGASVTQDSFRGSIVEGKNTGTVLDLSLDDAIARGFRSNLGVILQSSNQQNANGQRLQQLQALLPTISGGASIEVEQIDLAAFGLKIPGFPSIIGPFQVTDFRAYLTQSLFNVQALESYLASKRNFAGAKLTAQDARDFVTLTVGNAYLLCIADAARIEAVKAELQTANVTLNQATASHDAGVSPRIDVLRAQVDVQNEQQSLISANNQLAKDKIALARTIGLPLDQQFNLTDLIPYKALEGIDAETACQQALKSRKDLAASEEQIKAAEALKKAAFADRLPTASFSGDFGDQGTTAGHSHGTYTATGQVQAPILQIVKNRGEMEVADAQLQQARARYSDQLQQVNADVRDSLLDIQAAAKLVEATHTNVALATEELNEAQERFHAGVADDLPVSQAQSTFEQANDQYISALYQHNVAKLSLARALGAAQTNYKDYLGGK
jgi:outer membrane protein TolC